MKNSTVFEPYRIEKPELDLMYLMKIHSYPKLIYK